MATFGPNQHVILVKEVPTMSVTSFGVSRMTRLG
jgi:hypothetical protein